MRNPKNVTKYISLVLFFMVGPFLMNAFGSICCSWTANGCEHTVVIMGDDSELFTDCGGGPVYVGSGSYGGCPGPVSPCGLQ